METEGTTQEKGTRGQRADKNNQVRQAIIQSSNVWHGASYESLQPRGKKLLRSAKEELPFQGPARTRTGLNRSSSLRGKEKRCSCGSSEGDAGNEAVLVGGSC